tara:strand:- start:10108 stop:11325 length:1218 start_codon:yes stop_codon:yes gene_type:complete
MDTNTKFGLPKNVVHCKRCLMTNQKPFSTNESKSKIDSKKDSLVFNQEGVCAACIYNDEKKNINWEERELLLEEMLSKHRKTNGSYDCIISGSGGKDSQFQAHILKNKYNMHPLTVTYSPIIYTDVGTRNLRNWINVGGFDNYLFSPNGQVTSILTKEAFTNLLHPIQPFKFGIKTFAAKMAIKHEIDLIIYGEPYAEYGSSEKKQTDDAKYDLDWLVNDNEINIAGLSPNELKKKYQWIQDYDLNPYIPLKSKDIEESNLSVEFLGWYLKWDPQEIYYYAAKKSGFEVDDQRTDSTYGRYTGTDDKFEWLHFYCQYIKFGIGRCRFDASQEIRNGHITREEGILLCRKFEGNIPDRYLKDCFEFMNIDEKDAWHIIDKFRPDHLWEKRNGEWDLIQELPEIKKI